MYLIKVRFISILNIIYSQLTNDTHKVLYRYPQDKVRNGFLKTNKGVVRGHRKDRKDRAKHLFTYNFKLPEDAFKYFMKYDKVTLITKNENSINKGFDDWSKRYQIDPEIFPYRCGYATKYTDEALLYLQELALKNNIKIKE